MTDISYDTAVIGAGHAGCEAALASARMGVKTILFAIDLDKVASMPCSPSIGGTGKGQLVKEIDALGGEMAKITDKTAIQYKTLNTKKGPAVHSSRTQNDKNRYHTEMKKVIEQCPGLDLKQAMIEKIIVEDSKVKGLVDQTGFYYNAKTIIIATGTFMGGTVHIGESRIKAGRAGEFGSYGLPATLKELGFKLLRMKTGTPPRLKKNSIDFSKFQEHTADKNPKPFSFSNEKVQCLGNLPSYIGYTNQKNREIVLENIKRSSLYSGAIKGVSARYCPSFEDKAVKFPHREEHHVILEPEGIDTDEIYASGLGNSLPVEIQIPFVRAVKGLEEAVIIRPGYAIEYSVIKPEQLYPTLETKLVKGLYTAGQINGTSGYEEAAAQGLWAGINAASSILKKPPFILTRAMGYMGVMVDDLVTKGTSEPYRMFTSRVEYRLMLREDNANFRLAQKGYELGLISKEYVDMIREKTIKINNEINRIKNTIIKPSKEINLWLESQGSNQIDQGARLDKLMKRSEIGYDIVENFSPSPENIDDICKKQVEIEIKYEGYIERHKSEIEKFKNLEKIKIPESFSYKKINSLSNELREKLIRVSPINLGQASRIDGMTPSAISILMVALKAFKSSK
ncbi:MAG: tRNA uridine-5-carboxymethylaminomethyl(34) synthesis enzyme MnmG [Deltaproteobacteria bacterium]|nr:MAG: tRNA uridine-5-carboxymethylaminomethyl(34) synthesis enzyme MnmG [Deltaproteobacteria bacterium]